MKSARLALFQLGGMVAAALPAEQASRFAMALGHMLGRLPDGSGKRAVVASHLERVLGHTLASGERRRLVAEVFSNYARYWAESLRLPSTTLEEVRSAIKTVGEENLDDALALGHGVIICAPHFGGWEAGAMYLVARGLKVTVAVEPLEPPAVFEWFAGFRRRIGMEIVPVGPRAGGAVLQALHRGDVICLLSDRVVGNVPGVEVDFFGARAKVPVGPATLAIRAKAPLMSAAIYYGDRPGRHTIVFRAPVAVPSAGRLQERAQIAMQLIANDLEDLVRAAPAQWYLFQPNWPDDPPPRRLWRGPAV